MKVEELIQELEEYEGDREVYVMGVGGHAESSSSLEERRSGLALKKSSFIDGDEILVLV